MTVTDVAARVRALTDLGATLLIEAAAGTGKTALIAGRLTMLLANGCAPSSISAITFTEPAASELAARVHSYVERLLDGEIPTAIKDALPNGLSEAQHECLSASRAKLEELTISTIHGFCQTLIHSYAVEAGVDPGAQVIDAVQAEVAFDTAFDRWLRRRFSATAATDDPLAVLSREDPRHVVSTLGELARFRRQHRTGRPVAADLGGRPDIDLAEAVGRSRAGVRLYSRKQRRMLCLQAAKSFHGSTRIRSRGHQTLKPCGALRTLRQSRPCTGTPFISSAPN